MGAPPEEPPAGFHRSSKRRLRGAADGAWSQLGAAWKDRRAAKRKRKQEVKEVKKERKVNLDHVSKHRWDDCYREDEI